MARDDQAKSGKYFICQVSFNLVALAFICLLILILWRGHKDRQIEELISAAEENMEECQRMYRCDDMENDNRGKHKRGWSRQSDTICGSDGLLYNSECELNVVACQFPEINLVATDQSSCSSFKSVILIGGKSPSEGNIYARNERTGQFGPVCDDGWSFYGANVVCKQLGYSGAYKFTLESYFGKVTPSFSYHFLKCSGHEYSIDDCKNSFYSECSEFEAAGVICNDVNSMPVEIGGNGNGFPPSWSPPPLNTYTKPKP